MPMDFNQQIIDEFRANKGQVGGPFEGARLILLTTTGARSGAPHTVPLGYLPDGDRILVIASAGGSPRHPAWYHNLRADPRATVETGIFTYQAKAVALEGEERERVFARAVELDAGWAAYEKKSGRTLPVVALTATDFAPPAGGLGDALIAMHDNFRRELDLIRREVRASGPRLAAQLRVNCLTMCQGLHVHHSREDGHMFPAIADRYPEAAPVLARLRDEHEVIARLLDELQTLLRADDVAPPDLLAEVERLTRELEAHLDYEEQQLVPLLN
ncbi:nitroreductase family deazaflavin-dependent oxidoreductase [Nonomuraea sp. FMUSA5-5]|uniref:Nitroreductase family deazaflavin-dependent oxidoreductase n=1 Tax=Nonomuraea composti TaxID=2720023 RepID=A0ABX1B379_9ACTN|nr:nitroreductase/quinone reductase family protein [Nonomuraea sp. FMUSA5-5]NJP90952.1 nitroreductase family deazaflavin-dependent oxidoreductase [Nonomuraea sp. FMUSA5-5]